MFSRFFIDRPIFASVLSIVITIAGLVALLTLPIAQYPDIAPPTVLVACSYPGASAKVVAETIAAPIEQQVNGVENMLYMSSQCTNDGAYSLTITFKLGTDLDMAQVLVQNRVSLATPSLPDVVKQTGVTTKKQSPNIMLVVNLISPDQRYDQLYLSNFATIRIKDELARLDGVGDVAFLGQRDYSLRVWLDPEKLASVGLTASDVMASLREQNVQVAAGQIGQQPAPMGLDFQYNVTTLGRLTDPSQFGDIIIKTGSEGQVTRLRDVSRIELGARSSDQSCTLDGQPTVGLAVFQQPGGNAVETANRVRAKMEELKRHRFPQGLEYAIVYDTTPFVVESIHEVRKALFEAVLLVALVVLLFLQSWRATVIPLIAVPVSLVGTFGVMACLGFSLNNISLCGLVLAIGIVVDDAIVVVENVERWIEHGLTPREAAYKSMEEVTVAVIAIAFGLSAVFVPTAFLSGITGQFYRQFALTIATATLISAFNSLTLSPALAAILLRPRSAKQDILTRLLDGLFGWFFRGFNGLFHRATSVYERLVRLCVRGAAIALLVYLGLLGLTYFGFNTVPTGFLPEQDKGYLIVNAQLPESASLERSQAVTQKMEQIARDIPGVCHTVTIAGQSFLLNANGSNFSSMFVILDPFEQRHDADRSAKSIAAKLRRQCFIEIDDADVGVFGAPPVEGVGNAGGFKLMVEDLGDNSLDELQSQVDNLTKMGNAKPGLVGLFAMFRASTPQLYADIDRTKCKTMGVALSDVFDTLQACLGGYYVNDFNEFGRTWQVNVQADAKFRARALGVKQFKVRNKQGDMVPLGALCTIRDSKGPVLLNRYNTHTAAAINGEWSPSISSGQAISLMQDLAKRELPRSMGFEWTDLTYQQILAGNTAIFIFPLCILFVFLTHSAEYESWSLPLAIILIVPMSLLCALIGVWLRGMDNNLFTQIGFVVLAGLACKNAVLIVEFAKQQHEHGLDVQQAAIDASKLRLRPIVMTSLAFILGVVPLMLATGAGAEMRQTLGTAVFSGMLGVTLFGIFLTPVFYYVLQSSPAAWLSARQRKSDE
ncbi:MAG: multidrug efflux RND transporter permease subunit [Thermoguttaceae bacterium]